MKNWKWIPALLIALVAGLTACGKKKGGGGDVAAAPAAATTSTGPGGGCTVDTYGRCVGGWGSMNFEIGRRYWKGKLFPQGDTKTFMEFARRLGLCDGGFSGDGSWGRQFRNNCRDLDLLELRVWTISPTLPGRVYFSLTPYFEGTPYTYSRAASVTGYTASGDNGLVFVYRPEYSGWGSSATVGSRVMQVIMRYKDGDESTMNVGILWRDAQVAVGEMMESGHNSNNSGREDFNENDPYFAERDGFSDGGFESEEDFYEDVRTFRRPSCRPVRRCWNINRRNQCSFYYPANRSYMDHLRVRINIR